MSMTETRLDEARDLLKKVDNYKDDLPLYVRNDEDPIEALRRIRAYLIGIVDESQSLALAVVCLDRVLDNDRFPRSLWPSLRAVKRDQAL